VERALESKVKERGEEPEATEELNHDFNSSTRRWVTVTSSQRSRQECRTNKSLVQNHLNYLCFLGVPLLQLAYAGFVYTILEADLG